MGGKTDGSSVADNELQGDAVVEPVFWFAYPEELYKDVCVVVMAHPGNGVVHRGSGSFGDSSAHTNAIANMYLSCGGGLVAP